jgi:DICT domain-containing protein/predicted DNA-binding transcriptional regulator AlpA
MPMTGESQTSLSTTQLAQRTGVSAGTLRAWEARYGFPQPVRLAGGHHRYDERDVAAVSEVLRLRADGLSMAAAIVRARAAQIVPETSIYAALRRRRPDLQPFIASKRSLLALTHAIEDAHCACAGSGILIGSFQREHHYRRSQRRWDSFSRTLALSVALADFKELRVPARGVAEVPVDRDHQLSREWTVIVDSDEAKACLAAWELPDAREMPDQSRRFEVVWSFDPAAVAAATLATAGLLQTLAPGLAKRLPAEVDAPVPAAARPSELRFAADVAARAVAAMATTLDAAAG